MSPGNIRRWIETWNKKLHIYIGFYFLLFVWLFCISGLVKNHPTWSFAEYWSKRQQTSFEKPIQIPTEANDLAKARNIMRQLDISGEIAWTTTRPAEGHFDFRVTRPNKIIDVKTDLQEKRATVEQIKLGTWGVINMLHLFTGVRMDDSKEKRDWFMTKIWSFFMDAVSVGFIMLVLSGIYMWYCQERKKMLGWITLGCGVLICGFFIFGLVWVT